MDLGGSPSFSIFRVEQEYHSFRSIGASPEAVGRFSFEKNLKVQINFIEIFLFLINFSWLLRTQSFRSIGAVFEAVGKNSWKKSQKILTKIEKCVK